MRALALALLCACSHAPTIVATDVLTAVTDDWPSTKATLTLWHHDDRGWTKDGSWQTVIGYGGAAWGIGLHGGGPPPGHAGPVKHEGDGASPAGIFAIDGAFGFAASADTRLPYMQLRDTTECVDDPASNAYGRLVERTPAADWASSEKMRKVPGYEYGLVIAHNPRHFPRAGSCIFLHVWTDAEINTSGCTALPAADVHHLMTTVVPGTVFVLLPRAEYRALQDQWGLPPQ